MRVSLSWLNELVRVDVPAARLAEMLSMSGTKVETIVEPAKDISGVVVAEVLAIADHPNADNLVLVDVALPGESERVVCGVRNFSVGDRVPYARIGARLPGLEISERKIRGEVSRGMLCSGAELGISKDHAGILVLPPDAEVGTDVSSVLGLDDTMLELELTPDRPDCTGMIGIAREVAALLGHELQLPDASAEAGGSSPSGVAVKIADAEGCPRYLARYVEDVTVGTSPSWMSSRLLAAGIRPISNVVDATNYVMLETGQPLHAFDADKIKDRSIVVRRARARERFRTLDGVDRKLDAADLMIADSTRALAIAGVMGGEDSEVSPGTTSVVLEAAYFDPVSIARTSRRHGLRTEASSRFEKGMDPEVLPFAAARAVELMAETAGGRVSPEVVDAYPKEIARRTVSLRPRRASAVLGVEISAREQADRLRSIGLGVAEAGETLDVEVPGFRPDLVQEVDLIEEVGRLAGFERLPATLPPGVAGSLDAMQKTERRVRRILAGLGLREAWTSSFGREGDPDDLGLPRNHPSRKRVQIANPMSEDEATLRTTLVPGLLRSVAHNAAHQISDVALFELARIYEPVGRDLPQEPLVLAAVLSGRNAQPSWTETREPWDFFGAKGVLESLFQTLDLGRLAVEAATGMPFHPTRAASVKLKDDAIGVLGELHPDVCGRFDVPEGTVAFEIAIAPITANLPARVVVEELRRFPSIYIDVAIVVDETVAAESVDEVVRSEGAPELVGARLFDVYRGDQIEPGRKSLAFALELNDRERTLTDEDGVRVRDRIVAALEDRFGARLRA